MAILKHNVALALMHHMVNVSRIRSNPTYENYKIKTDQESGIVNDPNGWFADPRDLVAAIKRIVHVSVESTRIIEALPREITDGSEG